MTLDDHVWMGKMTMVLVSRSPCRYSKPRNCWWSTISPGYNHQAQPGYNHQPGYNQQPGYNHQSTLETSLVDGVITRSPVDLPKIQRHFLLRGLCPGKDYDSGRAAIASRQSECSSSIGANLSAAIAATAVTNIDQFVGWIIYFKHIHLQ